MPQGQVVWFSCEWQRTFSFSNPLFYTYIIWRRAINGWYVYVCSQWYLHRHIKSFIINSPCLILLHILRNMHTVFALLCFVVVIHWLIFPYPSGLLHWHCGNLTIAPVPAKQPWWIWINTSCEFIMNDCVTTTKQSTTKPCAYFLGYTVYCKDIVGHVGFHYTLIPSRDRLSFDVTIILSSIGHVRHYIKSITEPLLPL